MEMVQHILHFEKGRKIWLKYIYSKKGCKFGIYSVPSLIYLFDFYSSPFPPPPSPFPSSGGGGGVASQPGQRSKKKRKKLKDSRKRVARFALCSVYFFFFFFSPKEEFNWWRCVIRSMREEREKEGVSTVPNECGVLMEIRKREREVCSTR